MKNNRLLGRLWLLPVTLMLAWCFAACQSDPNVQQQNETDDPTLADYRIIRALGFDISDIVEFEDYYVVEGDIRIEKSALEGYSLQTKQYHCGALVSLENQKNITVRIDNSLINQSDWKDAIIKAINAWNTEAHCYIHMTYVTTSIADITFSYENLFLGFDVYGRPIRPIAQSSWPINGKPGKTVGVDTYHNNLNFGQKTWVIIHELGHNIGLRHTDYMKRDDNQSESKTFIENGIQYDAIHIPGTPTDNTDKESLMRSTLSIQSYPNYSFSNYDKAALQWLYPFFEPKISYRVDDPSGKIYIEKEVMFFASDFNTNAEIEWDLDTNGQAYDIIEGLLLTPGRYSNIITFVFHGIRKYTVKCRTHSGSYTSPWVTMTVSPKLLPLVDDGWWY